MSCPATQRTFAKDVHQLRKTIDASTGGQASIIAVDELTVKVCLRPKSGLNAHAEFLLTIKCSSMYPMECPDVTFDSPIFHPNINPDYGSVCVSLLSYWRSCYNLLDLVKAVLYLINHPAFDSPNNSFAMLDDISQLPTMTARVLAGVPIEGRRFPPNAAWCKWASENGCLPTEEEEGGKGMEGAENAVVIQDKFYQEDDEAIGACINTTDAELRESTIEGAYAPSDTTSVTVPSFAKMRYVFDPEDDAISWNSYENEWLPFEVESHRVLIWHPSNERNPNIYSIFYYIEFLGNDDHRSELGEHYNTLFIGNVLHEHQSRPDTRQTSSVCPWYAFSKYSRRPSYSSTSYVPSLHLDTMFDVKTSVEKPLTADFCPWSALDGRGINNLLGGLFFEVNRQRGNSTYFLGEDSDDGSENQCVALLFDTSSADNKNAFAAQSDLSGHVDSLSSRSEVSSSEEEDEEGEDEEQAHSAGASDEENKNVSSSASPSTYREVCVPYPLITQCTQCLDKYNYLRLAINAHLHSPWKWSIRRTRWSIRFAPQQNVDLSMTGIQIPPWRASSSRMMSDICLFCAKNKGMKNLVLLDPMALSPLSPLLNLMHYCEVPRPRLTGILWMTPLEALSPFYHVPIPVNEEEQENVHGRCEGDSDVYPTPLCLRFIAITALITNWVAWLSRMESYAALGMSRFYPTLIIAPVAACMLQPFSLGCGQAPLMDLWPMWLLRRLLSLSLRLSRLRFPFFHRSHSHLRYLFPFSDLDEI